MLALVKDLMAFVSLSAASLTFLAWADIVTQFS
jgi:hypothetical protein